MSEPFAYCGITCRSCPIYLATKQEDKEKQAGLRAEIVKVCKERYGLIYGLEEITDCDGCRTEGGRLFPGSRNCPVRKCAREKGLENCAYCPEYGCEKLESLFGTDPAARTRLDEVRKRLL